MRYIEWSDICLSFSFMSSRSERLLYSLFLLLLSFSFILSFLFLLFFLSLVLSFFLFSFSLFLFFLSCLFFFSLWWRNLHAMVDKCPYHLPEEHAVFDLDVTRVVSALATNPAFLYIFLLLSLLYLSLLFFTYGTILEPKWNQNGAILEPEWQPDDNQRLKSQCFQWLQSVMHCVIACRIT